MKIIELRAKNVKRLSAVEIKPGEGPVIIGGGNGQGKSSVLDSIVYALAGKKEICDKPVREGEKEAEVHIDLGEFTVTRKMKPDGKSSVVVQSKEGATFSSPQAMLDKLMGKLSFDPLSFTRMDAKKQVEQLKEVVGLDFTQEDDKRAILYTKRTDANREIKKLNGALETMPKHDDAPLEEVKVSELSEQFQEALAREDEKASRERQITSDTEGAKEMREQLDDYIVERERHISDQLKRLEATKKILDEMPEGVASGTIKAEIDEAEEQNQKWRDSNERLKIESDLQDDSDNVDEFTKEIEAIDDAKAEALRNAKFPVEGLSFSEDGLIFNGQPFDQASSAEQLKVAAAMGAALNPELRVILVHDGSLLDDKSLAELGKIAAEHDIQVWIERVGDGKEVTVLIEDGSVVRKEVDAKPVSV